MRAAAPSGQLDGEVGLKKGEQEDHPTRERKLRLYSALGKRRVSL